MAKHGFACCPARWEAVGFCGKETDLKKFNERSSYDELFTLIGTAKKQS